MSTIGIALLDVAPVPPEIESTHVADERDGGSGILRVRDEPLQAAPWPAPEGLVALGPAALRAILLGANGPDMCSTNVWTGAFTVGMMGGAWAGLTLLPALQMPLAGGWFAGVCIMGIWMFLLAVRAVRVQTADGGLIAQVLGADVSPACADAVETLVTGIQVLQACFVASQGFLYCAGALTVIGDPHIRVDMVVSMLIAMIALFIGSFQMGAMIVAVITSCEVLHDRCRRLTAHATNAGTAEQLHEVYLAMRELDSTLQRAVFALRPIVASVSARARPRARPQATHRSSCERSRLFPTFSRPRTR